MDYELIFHQIFPFNKTMDDKLIFIFKITQYAVFPIGWKIWIVPSQPEKFNKSTQSFWKGY